MKGTKIYNLCLIGWGKVPLAKDSFTINLGRGAWLELCNIILEESVGEGMVLLLLLCMNTLTPGRFSLCVYSGEKWEELLTCEDTTLKIFKPLFIGGNKGCTLFELELSIFDLFWIKWWMIWFNGNKTESNP